jgi:hypothetical protein
MLMPSPEVEREVEVDVEAEQATKLREMMDLEVEYAGPSATDYGTSKLNMIISHVIVS